MTTNDWEDDSPIHPERLSKWFDQRAKAARLPRITFHCLRHGYITMLIRAGQPLLVVNQRAGHNSINITTVVSEGIPLIHRGLRGLICLHIDQTMARD
jgi:integrase